MALAAGSLGAAGGWCGDAFAVRDNPALADLLRARRGNYNRQATMLELASAERGERAHVLQVAVPERTRLVGQLENNCERVTEALRLGAEAMASSIFTQPIDLCWQPMVYRATWPEAPAMVPTRTPATLRSAGVPAAEPAS